MVSPSRCMRLAAVLLLATMGAAHAQTGLHLPFDGSLNGTRGQTPSNASGVTFDTGKVGEAAVFDAGDVLEYPADTNIDPEEGTLELWYRPDWNPGTGNAYVLCLYNGGGGMMFVVDGGPNLRGIFNCWSPDQVNVITNVSSWRAGEWHHIAFTWSNSESLLCLYVDGALKDHWHLTSPLKTSTDPMIHVGSNGLVQDANGRMDEFSISTRAKSADEILLDYFGSGGVTGLRIEAAAQTMKVGWTRALRIYGTSDNGEALLPNSVATFETSNADVGTFHTPGKLTATGLGSAVITARVGSLSTTSALTVDRWGPQDVDVLRIERTPRLAFDPSDMTYSSGRPVVGQQMTYLAHVKNWGPSTQTVPYAWFLDGVEAERGSVTLGVGEEKTVPLCWLWSNTGSVLEFVADPENTLYDTYRLNNRVRIMTDALLVGLWIDEPLYEWFQDVQHVFNDGANSFDDWAQRMMRRWNDMLQFSSFPVAPYGALDRVALDKVTVVPQTTGSILDTSDLTVDMMWPYTWDPSVVGMWGYLMPVLSMGGYVDGGSIHEMSHGRFLVDLYGLNYWHNPADPLVQILDDGGNPVAGTPLMPVHSSTTLYYHRYFADIMQGFHVLTSFGAGAMNWKHHRRGRGNMNSPPDIGVFGNDLPDNNHVQFVDQLGRPLAGAEVWLYRSAERPGGWYWKTFDNTPDIIGIADAQGFVHWPRDPFGMSGGWYNLSTCGQAIVRVKFGGQLYYLTEEFTDYNIAYWMGQTGDAYYVRQIDVRDEPTTVTASKWLGNYYAGTGFDTYVSSREDDAVSFNWPGAPAPGVPDDGFSVYWLRDVDFAEGYYDWTITSNGGVRLLVDGRVVLDRWDNTSLNTWTVTDPIWGWDIRVIPGRSTFQRERRVELRYRHAGGDAIISASYAPTPPKLPVPVNAWRADYFTTPDRQGYRYSTLEQAIDNVYGNDIAAGQIGSVVWGGFGARWTGDWDFAPLSYDFAVVTTGPLCMTIDGTPVLDVPHTSTPQTYSLSREMSGRSRLSVEFGATYATGPVEDCHVRWTCSVHAQAVSAGALRILAGTNSVGTVTLSGPAPAGGMPVYLCATHPAVTVPATVTVPAGQTQTTFAVSTRPVAAGARFQLIADCGGAQAATESLLDTHADTALWTVNRSGTITEAVTLRAYDLKRTADNALLAGKTIVFKIDGTSVGTGTTDAGGDASLSWTITDGPATRTITTAFEGDTAYNPSSANATLTCQTWTTKMATFNRTVRITDRTELKARLLRSDNTPLYGFPISFSVDGTFVITRNTNTDGYASYPYYDVPDGAGAGARTILSEWAGNAGYAAVAKTAVLDVKKAISYIWVLSKSVPQGGVANLYAYFRRLYDYKKQESKTVSFLIDGTWVADAVTGSAAFEPGVARHLYPTTGLSIGQHTIRCEFAGDAWLDPGSGEGRLNIL